MLPLSLTYRPRLLTTMVASPGHVSLCEYGKTIPHTPDHMVSYAN